MTRKQVGAHPAAFWAPVGIDYADDELTLNEIIDKYGITLGQFNSAKKHFAWPNRRKHVRIVDRTQVIARLFGIVDRMVGKLETGLEDELSKLGDAEVTVLGRLVQSMGKLIEIEAASNRAATPRETKDMHDIRRKLVERIAELKRG